MGNGPIQPIYPPTPTPSPNPEIEVLGEVEPDSIEDLITQMAKEARANSPLWVQVRGSKVYNKGTWARRTFPDLEWKARNLPNVGKVLRCKLPVKDITPEKGV